MNLTKLAIALATSTSSVPRYPWSSSAKQSLETLDDLSRRQTVNNRNGCRLLLGLRRLSAVAFSEKEPVSGSSVLAKVAPRLAPPWVAKPRHKRRCRFTCKAIELTHHERTIAGESQADIAKPERSRNQAQNHQPDPGQRGG